MSGPVPSEKHFMQATVFRTALQGTCNISCPDLMFINAFTLALPGYSSLLDAEANHSSKLQAQRPSNVGIASHGGAQ